MNKPKIIVVNEKDEIIGFKDREKINSEDIYRVSALWIQNSQGEILLAQRALSKKKAPGKWGPAVTGTNDEGETYESNIIKEAGEELGLKDFVIKRSFHERNNGLHNHFNQWFFAIIDKEIKEFTIRRGEVEKVRWFTKKELLEKLDKKPEIFLDHIKRCVEYFGK